MDAVAASPRMGRPGLVAFIERKFGAAPVMLDGIATGVQHAAADPALPKLNASQRMWRKVLAKQRMSRTDTDEGIGVE